MIVNPNFALQTIADTMKEVDDREFIPIKIKPNLQSHILGIIAAIANPNSIMIIDDQTKDSIPFFEAYDINFDDTGLHEWDYRFSDSIIGEDLDEELYYPLSCYTIEEIKQIASLLTYESLLPEYVQTGVTSG